ncbi:MAG TPA: SGNH/GDSL hydrolase family protein [Acidimicrobiales bacterium]|nr:SGNH/GDSL hydrolase family protein [Acidimicrobiales bacterium]
MTAAAGVMGVVLIVPLTLTSAGTTPPAEAAVSAHEPSYLALGDSITFGFREGSTVPPPAYTDARSFVGYPEDVGAALGWRVVNAACPGETAASFINVRALSNGCETFATGRPGYRGSFPLHVTYRGPQLRYAVTYLRAHPETKLVSLMIGVNDLFACVATTADHCTSEHGEVLGKIADDVAHILGTIRKSGRYTGQIVVVNYYSLSSADSVGSAALFDDTGIAQLNAAVDHAAAPFAVSVASGEGVFQSAALQSGGDSCVAGLLTQLKGGGCGIHPSVAGQAVLALAVERVIRL